MLKICNKCKFQQDEFLNLGGRNYCKSCGSEIKIDSNQMSLQEQKTLHQMKLLLSNLHYMLEPLEEFIDKAGYYPNFRSKRQLYRKTLRDSEGPLENDEDLFLSQVFIFASAIQGEPDFFREVTRQEFYKWINYTGITADNCPEVLKHFLIEINNVINGNDEKIIRETREKTRNYEINPKDIIGLFSGLQQPLNRSREQKVALEGKIWNELPNEDKFDGNPELGKRVFEEIERSVSVPHENYRLRYFGEKRPEQGIRNPNYRHLIDDPSEEFLNLNHGDGMDVDETDSSTYRQQKQSPHEATIFNPKTPKSNNSNLGTISLIVGVLVLASLGIYGVVKKPKKVKTSR